MMRGARCVRAVVLAMAVVLGGCSVLGPKPSQQTLTSDPESVNVGYALLYGIVSTQKNSEKLLIVKRVSPEVRSAIRAISEAADAIEEDLQKFARADPAVQLDRRVLPLIEAKQRESAQAERAKDFFATSGKPFERLLILTQSGVLTTERHIARVMRDAERNPQRRAFWERTAKTFDDLYARLIKLLEDQYYSP